MNSSFRIFDKDNFLFSKIFLVALEAKISWLKSVSKFLYLLSFVFSGFLKRIHFTFLLAVSKRLKIQIPDWTHFKDFLIMFNLFFYNICTDFRGGDIFGRCRYTFFQDGIKVRIINLLDSRIHNPGLCPCIFRRYDKDLIDTYLLPHSGPLYILRGTRIYTWK